MKKTTFQEFIENLVITLLSIIKIILMSNFSIKSFKTKNNVNNCIILGNGPSLKNSLQNDIETIKNTDSFAVNFFWKSEYYTIVKPKYYVIVSTNYWAKGKIDSNEQERQQTFTQIANLTNWQMTLIVPAIAKKHINWKQTIRQNKNITIEYLNITPIEGFTWFTNLCFKHNLGLPRPHNVLIPAIKIATDYNYKNIYIIGADHSWLKEIFVAPNNQVYLTQKHFYNNTPDPETMYDGTSNRVRTLSEVLMKFVYSFKSYFILNKYAIKKNINIFNSTPDSFIDAFTRKPLNF
jgi:hypothetical protein